MNKYKQLFKFICIFIFLINSCLSTVTIQDITQNSRDSYANSVTGRCSFKFYFLITNDGSTGYANQMTDSLSMFNSAVLFFNSTTSIIQIDTYNVQVGVYQPVLSAIIQSVEYDYQGFQFSCVSIDPSSMGFEQVGKFRLIKPYGYKGIFKLVGVTLDLDKFYDITDQPVSFDNFNVNCNSRPIIGTQYYEFTIDTNTDVYQVNTLSFKIYIMGIGYQYTFNDIIESTNDEIGNFKFYPNFNEPIKQMGVQLNGLVTFDSNLTLDYNTIYGISPNGATIVNLLIYTPILSKDNVITYIAQIDPLDNLIYNYGIYSQNGSKSLKNSINSSITVTEFKTFSTLPTTPNPQNLIGGQTYQAITLGFNNENTYNFSPFIFSLYAPNTNIISYQTAPYGFYSGSFKNYSFQISTLARITSQTQSQLSIKSIYDSSGVQMGINYNSATPNVPVINNFEYIHLFDNLYILRMNITSEQGVNRIRADGGNSDLKSLISGSIYDGIFEIFVDYSITVIIIFDNMENIYYNVVPGSPISMTPLSFFQPPMLSNYVQNDINNNLQNLSFKLNDIDVTNTSVSNSLYFNMGGNFDKNSSIILRLLDQGSAIVLTDRYNDFSGFWNESIQQFQVDFYIKANSQAGSNFPYYLTLNFQFTIFSYSLPLSYQLRVKSSNMDLYGPIFNSIVKINDSSVISSTIGTNVGWKIKIEDLYNGFDNGFITIKSTIDGSIYNFTITPSNVTNGDKFIGEYELLINVSNPCISQSLVITDVLLFDTIGRKSTFSIMSASSTSIKVESVFNPFINYLSDSTINVLSFTCTAKQPESLDSTPPLIKSYSLLSSNTIDVGSNKRVVSVIFQTQDLESGIKFGNGLQNPIVYLSAVDLNIISCESKIVNSTNTTVNYKCDIELPVAFGFPHGIAVSIYGIINNNGLFKGYTGVDLATAGNSFIDTTYTYATPLITDNQPTSEYGGTLWLFGKGFTIGDIVKISYSDDNLGYVTHIVGVTQSIAISVLNVKKTRKPFSVKVIRSRIESNIYIVTPVLYEFKTDAIIAPTITPIPTVTPIPTNAPQVCKSNCGGSKNGYCSSSGCICYPPWIGNDCLSQVIVIPQPTINSTNPSTEIPIIPGDNNGSGNTPNSIVFKSLISLVSLREIGFDNSVINEYPFDKWVSTMINNSTQQYDTSISVLKQDGITISSITNITVTLEWFKDLTNITFANEQLTMNPSTLKYTIQLSSYEFKSNLNKLQLIMSASFESSKSNDICSSSKFGDTSSGDNSNYIKIQVDQYSLFGRFIKRGIFDNTVLSVSNEILDSSFSPISKPNQVQSYIGINIPHYLNEALIDPDFSVLIDSNKVTSDSDNSICTSSGKPLSVPQIVGIVIGCAAFLAVIVIATVYHIVKKKKQSIFFNKMSKIILKNES